MYRVLIAEDEMLVRLGLKNSMNWSKFDMSVIADVSNGQDALEAYQTYGADLLITDIKMPVMDGMKLISAIREQDREIRIIILTCLEELDLARKAMSLNVSDYILKLTMTVEDMEKVLRKLQLEMNERSSHNPPKGMVDADVVKENVIKDFLFRNRYKDHELASNIRELGLRLSPGRLLLCMMEIDNFERLRQSFKDEKGSLIRMSLLNVLDEVLNGYGIGEAIHDEGSRYMLIFSFHAVPSEQRIYEMLQGILEHLRNVLVTYFNVTVTFGVSSLQNGFSSLKGQYRQGVQALGQKFFKGTGLTFYYHDSEDAEIHGLLHEKTRQLSGKWDALNENCRAELAAKIETLRSCRSFSSGEDVKTYFIQWLYWPVISLGLINENVVPILMNHMEKIRHANTLDAVIDSYGEYLGDVAKLKSRQRSVSRETAEVIRYIENNYEKDITLQQTANHVLMSPNYLSSLFKKEMGIGFVEYLLQYRIEKAKEMLLSTSLKSYEISLRVGFNDNAYFSRMFKKLTGESPREFRKKWMVDWVEEPENE